MRALERADTRETAVPALVVDLAGMACFEALVYDFSDKGCKVVSDQIDLLKDEIGLRIKDFDKMLRGTVIGFSDDEAHVSFDEKTDEPGEKRREIRRPVYISTIVCSRISTATFKCHIVDASKSGCRLEGDNIAKLPDVIDIAIPGLDLPVGGIIVWRNKYQAGVQLKWPFKEKSVKTEKAGAAPKVETETNPQEPKTRRRNRGGAFGDR